MSKDYTGVVLLAFIALLALYVYPWRVLALIGGIVVVLAVQIGIHFIYEKYQKWYWREKK